MREPAIRHEVVGPFVQNAWLVHCPGKREGILVDPGFEPERILAMVEDAGVTVREVVATHGHIDHVWGATTVCEALGAPFRMHPADAYWLEGLERQAAMFGLEPPPGVPRIDRPLADGDRIGFGEVSLEVLLTPGHTPGSVCLHDGAGNLFTGDTLFQGSIGRTDFPGGSFEAIVESIRRRIFSLPPGTLVHPGHGPSTRVDAEKADNPFVGDGAGGAGGGIVRFV